MVFIRRWSSRSKLFVLLSVLAGLSSFLLVRGYAAELEALRPITGDPVPVVVAARELGRGTVLTAEALAVREIPSAYVPPGAIASLERAEGQTLVTDLAEGEPVTRTRVGVRGGPVASLVPPGLRAYPVSTGLPAGSVAAGDRVDVLATFGGPHPYTDTVASGLEVLTIVEGDGDAFSAGGPSGPSLVLLVSPYVAERLAYASSFGQLAVVIAPPPG